MNIQDLQTLYAKLPQVGALAKAMGNERNKTIFLQGLLASAAPLTFSALALKRPSTLLFVLQDADEAGYFYHDLCQVMGDKQVLFFPSSYRRAVKYGQRDAASEILRTEVLTRLQSHHAATELEPSADSLSSADSQSSAESQSALYIVTHPEALAELVVSQQRLDARTLSLHKDQTISTKDILKTLREFGFKEQDYVYEPGQFALRGSILDVYSYSSEYPFRVDFFGDDIDSIRTFEVETQLSRDVQQQVSIVPELAQMTEDRIPLLRFMPKDTLLVMKDFIYVRDAIDRTYQDGFSQQAITEKMEGATEAEQKAIMEELRKDIQLTSGPQFTRH